MDKQDKLDLLEKIVREKNDSFLRVAIRVVYYQEDAKDAVQDGLVRAIENIDKFRDGSRREMLSWLYLIVFRCALNVRRKNKKDREFCEPLDFVSYMVRADSRPPFNDEFSDKTLDCIDRLSQDFRDVIILVDIMGMKYCEAAAELKCNRQTIGTRLFRARKQMQKNLKRL